MVKKYWGTVVLVIVGLWGITLVCLYLKANAEYETKIGAYWTIACSSTTFQAKERSTQNFITAMETADLHGQYMNVLFKTPTKSFDINYELITVHHLRLEQLKETEPATGLDYQNAMKQTHSDEVNLSPSIDVIKESWLTKYHWSLSCGPLAIQGIVILLASLLVLFKW